MLKNVLITFILIYTSILTCVMHIINFYFIWLKFIKNNIFEYINYVTIKICNNKYILIYKLYFRFYDKQFIS